jgi:catechol 2,3-dioxygenase-like lactoylglutathione lyase family enzyme
MNAAFHHVNVTVPRSLEAETKHFYRVVLGLTEVPKPEASRGRGGAWYQVGAVQLHLSIEEGLGENCISNRHVCYSVDNLDEAEQRFQDAGVEISPDDETPASTRWRFFVRDPGGNRLEIAQVG